ncbi:MAG: alpha-mannosidase [Clostridia bacterium]|nr:alpha-mannosidase [Clostridia bacterium]
MVIIMIGKTQFYCVGNAHLDPVWQWKWQEGSAEAKATIRSALDRMKEFPDFKFVCSSASVYQWIEEFDGAMFEELKERVKEGRFVVVGGWHVQPDCNLPSGEGFARQSLYAQRYFKEKLGVTAKVGYNVDSFGHNLMLPQILKKSGMEMYIFMRPSEGEKSLPSDVFRWTSPDQSSVLAYRILMPYCAQFQTREELDAYITRLQNETKTELACVPLFYGVGNHGGGPTIRHITLLNEHKESHPEHEIIFSDLWDFYQRIAEDGYDIPVYRDDLQHHASGCYAAVSKIKNGIRRAECSLTAAENDAMLSYALCKKNYPGEMFKEAWKTVCFLHFHDSMGGCSIKEVYDDAAYMYGMAQHTAAVADNNALQTISWAVDTSHAADRGLPIFVMNPHAFPVETVVTVNKQGTGVTDENGTPVPSQLVHSSTLECYWREDTAFMAKVPALGYAVYYLQQSPPTAEENGQKKESPVRAVAYSGVRTANSHETTVLENEFWHIEFDLHTGYIVSFVNRETGKECITGRAAVPTVIDEYTHDTWSHGKNFFTEELARFSDAEVTVLENGPVRATVKVISRYNASTLTQYFSLCVGARQLLVRAKLDWHETHKMLKLAWPMAVAHPKAYYEIPFGVIERPADGEEEPGLTWFAVKGDDGNGNPCGYAICNSDTYSSSVRENTLYHTVVRSPIYGDHGGPRTAESEFTDQGEREFHYALLPYTTNGDVIRCAKLLNQPCTNIIENWHTGKIKEQRLTGLSVDCDHVIVSAVKRAEDGCGTVLRVYETDGKAAHVTIDGAVLAKALVTEITPYSVMTFYLPDNGGDWREVLITEFER